MVHEAVNRLSTSITESFAVFVASFWWGCEEIEGGIGEEVVGSWWGSFHTVFMKIVITFFTAVTRTKTLLLAAITNVWFFVAFELKFMLVAFGTKLLCCYFWTVSSRNHFRCAGVRKHRESGYWITLEMKLQIVNVGMIFIWPWLDYVFIRLLVSEVSE